MRRASLVQSFLAALAGVRHVFVTQRNARIETAILVLVVIAGVWLELSSLQWAVIAVCAGSVLATEIVNTALEAVVNLLSPEYHDSARDAKDTAAAAVLIVSIASVVVGLMILGPPLWSRLFG